MHFDPRGAKISKKANAAERGPFIKKTLFPCAPNLYKANLHTHTVFSDGLLTAEEIRDLYTSLGYQIVAYSDHEVCASHKDLAREDFLPITAYEMAVNPSADRNRKINDKCYHLGLLARDPDNTRHICFDRGYVRDFWPCALAEIRNHNEENRVYTTEFVNHLIRTAREAGWLVTLNHPTWSMQDREDYIGLEGLWGVELYNHTCAQSGYMESDERVYEEMLRAGIPIFPIAADDIHKAQAAGGGWLMVSAEALNHEAVFAAFDRGDFYASNGPELKSISIDGSKLTVTCSACRSVRVNTELRCAFRADRAKESPLTEAEFDLQKWFDLCPEGKEDRAFLRVTVTDEQGNMAWSRSYARNELL